MNRSELEHVIRAAAAISGDDRIVVTGSQAILGSHPDAPPELCFSRDVDLWPLHHPGRADLVDASIGELSPFHETFGYYAQGVGPETAILPEGWQSRLVGVPAGPAVGLCLEPHDLVISKYAAGRERDREYVRIAARVGLVTRETLLERLAATPLDEERRALARERIEADFRP